MAVVDGSFVFMGFSDNGEPLLTDPDQSCSSSCEPTLINLSNEAPIKKGKLAEVTVVATSKWLSEPCPLPVLSDKTKEILKVGI